MPVYPYPQQSVAALSLVVFASSSLAAESAENASATDSTHLGQMVVTGEWLGTPTQETIKTYPGARSVVTDTEIHRSGARNLEDALRLVPGVRVQDETGVGILPNIGVRGLNPARSERALVLVDGIPVALAPYTATGLSLFPVTMQSIQAIDVARGGVAVRYGPNNVGGVINFVTKAIPNEFGVSTKEQLTFANETGNLLSNSYFQVGGFVTDDLGLQLQANTVQGNGWRDHSETEVYNVMLRADWFPSDDTEVKARLQYYKTNTELPGALTPEAYDHERSDSQRPLDKFLAKTWRGSLDVTHQFDGGEFKWTHFGHTSKRKFVFGSPFDPTETITDEDSSPRDFFVIGSEPRLTLAFPLAGIDHQVTIGGRYVREEVDFIVDRESLADASITRRRNWWFETDAVAAYISDTLSFFDGRLKLTPGLRYENVVTGFTNKLNGEDDKNRSEELLPGMDIGLQATENLFWFANFHRSLRPPQVAQVTRGGDVGAETSLNYETGVRFTPMPGLDTTVTLFRFDFDDQIEFDRTSLSFRNIGETRHQGVEVETIWQPWFLSGLSLKANYTYVDAEQRTGEFNGNDVPFVSDHQFNVTGDYSIASYHFNINGHYQDTSYSDTANTVQEDDSGTVGEMPAYWTWNAAATRRFKAGNGATVETVLAINNMFDREYYFRGVDVSPIGRVPGPGRSIMLTFQLDI